MSDMMRLARTLALRSSRSGNLPSRAGCGAMFAPFKRSMFIQTEQTPNPDSLKFMPGRSVLGDSMSRDFRTFRDAQVSPLAKRLFQTEGIAGVFLASDFITVTKAEATDWLTLKPLVFASIMDFYAADEPALTNGSGEDEVDSLAIHDDDSEVVQMIKELLDMRIRPSVQEDGGDIKFHGFDEDSGVVTLEMQGSCSGCPSSSVTLKSGIENMLMHYIPEVKEVTNLSGEMEDEGELP